MSFSTKVAQIAAIGLLALSTTVFSANESMVLKQDGNEIRIFLTPCTTVAGVFATAPKEIRDAMRAAEVLYRGKHYEACWLQADMQSILIVDETGDQGEAPLSSFVRESK